MIRLIIEILGVFAVVATLLPILKHEAWWIRVFDFPRLQILFLSLFCLFVFVVISPPFSTFEYSFLAFLLCSIIFQLVRIFPYTFFHKKQVHDANKNDPQNSIGFLVTNVLMTNRNSDACLSMIRKANPDIILAVETDKWWEMELRGLLENYPYHSFAPHANTYGLLLFSRFKLLDCEIKYILDHDIPSIHCTAELPSGIKIKVYGVHPKPPAPQESRTTVKRDAELLIVGNEVRNFKKPVIVAGDLNDVAWSHTTHLFQRISGLLDPRIGRGMYPTFNSKKILMRWPLDHIFHSAHFKIIDLKRLEHIGSDHFPIYIKLSYEPDTVTFEEKPEADHSDIKEAKEKVIEASKL